MVIYFGIAADVCGHRLGGSDVSDPSFNYKMNFMRRKVIAALGVSFMMLLMSCSKTNITQSAQEGIASETAFEENLEEDVFSVSSEETGASGQESVSETIQENTTTVEEETEVPVLQDGEYEYPEEDAGNVRNDSRLGYSMVFDPTAFTLDILHGSRRFRISPG